MSAIEIIAPATCYAINGETRDTQHPAFAPLIAEAHVAHSRPRCLCVPGGVEMYIARLGDGYILKRLPDSGQHHAPDCPSFEPPASASGLGQMLGSAITEDPESGHTLLRLDFALSKTPGRASAPPAAGVGDSVTTVGTRLSLRGLLHYLWDQAELTHWHPGFAGKRNWATVRRHLLQAARQMQARGETLDTRLFIPEVFSVEKRMELNARRLAQWAPAFARPGKVQRLLLLLGEVREIAPARYGHCAVIKHLPDVGFSLDAQLYRRMAKHFESELSLWGASSDIHMVMMATFSVLPSGAPSIVALMLMPVTNEWVPVDGAFEKQLIDALVSGGRCFVKAMRYDHTVDVDLTCATLTDTAAPVALHVAATCPPGASHTDLCGIDSTTPEWRWQPGVTLMPVLPPKRTASQRGHSARPDT